MKRTKSIKIRVTDDEYKVLRMLCTRPHLAQWMREVCLSAGQQDLNLEAGRGVLTPQLLRSLAAAGFELSYAMQTLRESKWSQVDKDQFGRTLADIKQALNDLRGHQDAFQTNKRESCI